MAFHIAPCRLLKSGGIWPSRKAVPECGTMSDISHSTAPEQELIYYPASSGIRLHVSIYNTAASKGKKKKEVIVFLLFSSLEANYHSWK